MTATIPELVSDLLARGVRRVHVLAWRDLDDRDAGGSEVHADEFMRRWAAAGLDVVHRTSAAVGLPAETERHGYRVIRRGSRYDVFPRTAVAEILGRMGPYDALVEIWNGVPWLSPLWSRRPRITVLHHVHGPMWDQILPRPLAGVGRVTEARLAPPFYRRTRVITPSEATRQELLGLGFRAEKVTTVANGVDDFFSPGPDRSPDPLVVAVGRFAPVKRFELAIVAALDAKRQVPALRLRLIGDGPLRAELAALIARHGASDWIDLVGHVSRAQLRDEYRRAWVALSASLAEGWGLTLTEAAACGTPAVATDIGGHRCSVVDGMTGVLAAPDDLGAALAGVLSDDARREALGAAALARARTLTWEASATGLLVALHHEVVARRSRVTPTTGPERAIGLACRGVSVLVVIPTYNEVENVGRLLPAIRQAVPDVDVLVVDDSSPDGTGGLVEKTAIELDGALGRIDLLERPGKQGLGSAYRHGFALALERGYDVIVSMDVDLSHDPVVIAEMLRLIDAGADAVIGSRYVPGGDTVDWPVYRRLLSRCGNRYTSLVLGLRVRDCTSGFRAYRATALRTIDPASTSAEGYAFLTELVRRLVRGGCRVVETPIVFTDRRYGSSKMSGRIVTESMLLVTRWALRDLLTRGR